MSFDDLRPLAGVTDLVVEHLHLKGTIEIKRLFLEGYFPDLCHLTLRLQPFWLLWYNGDMPLLLDCRRPDGSNERKFYKFLVVDVMNLVMCGIRMLGRN